MKLVLILFVSSLLAAAAPASAAEVTHVSAPADRNVISSCLAESDSPYACLGAVSVVCIRLSGADNPDVEASCMEREATIWRERLNDAAQRLLTVLKPAQRNRFVALQEAWQAYIGLKCGPGDHPSSPRAVLYQSQCEMREVAMRTIEVERSLKHAGKPS